MPVIVNQSVQTKAVTDDGDVGGGDCQNCAKTLSVEEICPGSLVGIQVSRISIS